MKLGLYFPGYIDNFVEILSFEITVPFSGIICFSQKIENGSGDSLFVLKVESIANFLFQY